MPRGLLFLPLFAIAIAGGIPYLLSSSNVDDMMSGDESTDAEAEPAATISASEPETPLASAPAAPVANVAGGNGEISAWNVDPTTGALVPAESTAAASGPRTYHLAEVIRFDITPEWVLRHWSRVSMDRLKPGLEGYRVALVTGTRVDDLAGSLTYYFDARRKLTHITFYGTTGDWQRLSALLTRRYGFRRREVENTSGHLLVVSKFDQTISWCQIEPVDVIDSQRIHSRYRVSLNMRRPLTMR